MFQTISGYGPDRPSLIYVGDELGTLLAREALAPGRAFLVVEEVVWRLHRCRLPLQPSGLLVVPSAGERLKTLGRVQWLAQWMYRQKVGRQDRIIVAGGGALLDTAGFAAAIYNRGVPTVLVPTTLLSQIDVAVGGKCGINFRGVKNLVGSFHFPHRVYCGTDVLNTLSRRQLNAAMGEVWKYWLLDPSPQLPSLFPPGSPQLTGLVAGCCACKNAVVAADPLDRGQRAHLNLGHTLAHALEGVDHNLLHGEAVLWGLEFALRLAMLQGVLDCDRGNKIIGRLRRLPRPALPRVTFGRLLPLLQRDKKHSGNGITMILPTDRGIEINQCPVRELRHVWGEMYGGPDNKRPSGVCRQH